MKNQNIRVNNDKIKAVKKHKIKAWIYGLIFCALSLLIIVESCIPSEGSSKQSSIFAFLFDRGPLQTEIIQPENLTINGKDTIFIGEQETYSVEFNPSNTTDKTITWELEDTSNCVQVINSNTFKGLNEGSISLKATSKANNNLYTSISINVMKETLTSLQISLTTEDTLIKGVSSKLNISSNLASVDNSDLTYVISNPEIISINEENYISTLKEGETELYIYKKDDSSIKSNTVNIKVISGEFINVTSMEYQGSNSLYCSSTNPINFNFNPHASDLAYKYQISNTNLSIINNQIHANNVGSSSITFQSVSNPLITSTINFEIKEVKAKGIVINDSTIQYGKTVRLNYSLTPEIENLAVTNSQVRFDSSDESIATIDEGGNFIGYKKGNVEISVTLISNPHISTSQNISVTSIDSNTFNELHTLVRKLFGHFSFFLLTGIFGMLFANEVIYNKKHLLLTCLINLCYAFTLASVSELLQLLAPGRGCAFKDVLIDTSGYLISIVVIGLIFYLISYFKKKKESNKKKE